MAPATLYDLGDARRILEEWLLEEEGDVTPALEQLLADLDVQADAKIERVALYIREQLAQAAAIEVEEKRITAMRRTKERAADGLKRYLEREMERLGKTKVAGALCTVALQKNPPSLKGELAEETLRQLHAAELPFVKRVPATFTLDRRGALDSWKLDGILPAGLTVEQSTSIRIR